jgi:hypothetical protein
MNPGKSRPKAIISVIICFFIKKIASDSFFIFQLSLQRDFNDRSNMIFDKEILEEIKQTVKESTPDATIVLYGSRARGDAGRIRIGIF